LNIDYVPPPENQRQFSPQHDMWLVETKPDYTKPGPWTTTIVVGTSGNGRPSKLTVVDHASGGVHIQWLNEKLLFVQVWWGRIVSTDLILDAEKRSFTYKEMATHQWAYAEYYGLPELISEDFEHGRMYGSVRVVNPFLNPFLNGTL
jgi:hypothetical protein